MSNTISFGRWLKQQRKELDITQANLALCVGCSEKMIEKIEAEQRRPSRQIATLLAGCLNIPQEEHEAFISFTRATPRADAVPATTQAVGGAPWRLLLHHPNNLPAYPNSFIGRREELAATMALMRRPGVRLLTLIGAAGIGKTRLALEMAEHLLEDFEEGVFFVGLASVNDPGLVVSVVARALGVQEGPGRMLLDTLKDHLRARQILLLIDNVEQLLGNAHSNSATTLISELLSSAPYLKVLVTSRERLHLYGEYDFAVPPLRTPQRQQLRGLEARDVNSLMRYEAVELFVERAVAVDTEFALTSKNAAAVAEVCSHLDGLPLAIELAAASTEFISPQVMLPQLHHSLGLLTAGPKDIADRHRTMRGAIGWSYDLLDESEKALFRQLGVFVGGWSLEAAESVVGEISLGSDSGHVLGGLESLVRKNLIQQEAQANGTHRFRMLSTIKEYALEQLAAGVPTNAYPKDDPTRCDDVDDVKRRHAAYFLQLAEKAEPELKKPGQLAWLDLLEVEHDNVRAALTWTLSNEPLIGLRLAGAMWRFWWARGFISEGRARLAAALANESPTTGGALEARAKALNGAGVLSIFQGDYESARLLLDEALAIMRDLGDKQGTARILNNLGQATMYQGDYLVAHSIHSESLEIMRELEDLPGIANALHNLALAACSQGEFSEALSLFQESLTLRKRLGDQRAIASSLNNLGIVSRHLGDHEQAEALCRESLLMRNELDDRLGIAYSLMGLAGIEAMQSKPNAAVKAVVVLGAAETLLQSVGTNMEPFHRAEFDHCLAAGRAQLSAAAFVEAWRVGCAMNQDEAIAYALEDDSQLGNAQLRVFRGFSQTGMSD
jgi:predicted ATPase/DNA-binding XRE family transcriptional regulator